MSTTLGHEEAKHAGFLEVILGGVVVQLAEGKGKVGGGRGDILGAVVARLVVVCGPEDEGEGGSDLIMLLGDWRQRLQLRTGLVVLLKRRPGWVNTEYCSPIN